MMEGSSVGAQCRGFAGFGVSQRCTVRLFTGGILT